MLMFRNKFSVCGIVNWVNEWSVFEGNFCNTTLWAFRKFVFDKTCNPTAVITLLYTAVQLQTVSFIDGSVICYL